MGWVKWVFGKWSRRKENNSCELVVMVLDLGEWAGGRTAKCHKKDGKVG